MRKLLRFVAIGAALAGLYAVGVRADTVVLYSTGMAPASGSASVTGTENSAVVTLNTFGRHTLLLIAVENYDATNPKVAMAFDATALPANGTIPLVACAAGAAAAPGNPGQCSFALPADGLGTTKGIVIACSTTGKTLTVDTTANGNCYFQVSYR